MSTIVVRPSEIPHQVRLNSSDRINIVLLILGFMTIIVNIFILVAGSICVDAYVEKNNNTTFCAEKLNIHTLKESILFLVLGAIFSNCCATACCKTALREWNIRIG